MVGGIDCASVEPAVGSAWKDSSMAQRSGRINCPRCQSNNFDTVTVCWKCGASLVTGAPSQPAMALPQAPYPSAAPPSGYAQSTGQERFAGMQAMAASVVAASSNPSADQSGGVQAWAIDAIFRLADWTGLRHVRRSPSSGGRADLHSLEHDFRCHPPALYGRRFAGNAEVADVRSRSGEIAARAARRVGRRAWWRRTGRRARVNSGTADLSLQRLI